LYRYRRGSQKKWCEKSIGCATENGTSIRHRNSQKLMQLYELRQFCWIGTVRAKTFGHGRHPERRDFRRRETFQTKKPRGFDCRFTPPISTIGPSQAFLVWRLHRRASKIASHDPTWSCPPGRFPRLSAHSNGTHLRGSRGEPVFFLLINSWYCRTPPRRGPRTWD